MKTKFTEGDWVYRPCDSDVYTTKNIIGNIICEAPSDDYEESRLNWEANAKLIAAAPDLLEACIRSLQVLDEENIFGQARLLLVLAIKKATE